MWQQAVVTFQKVGWDFISAWSFASGGVLKSNLKF